MASHEKVVQTTLSPEEHAILRDFANQHNLSIKAAVKMAILALLKSDQVEAEDPYFSLKVKSCFSVEKASQEVDQLVYKND
jgi:hypothetical protein